jgi:hypothetical protein
VAAKAFSSGKRGKLHFYAWRRSPIYAEAYGTVFSCPRASAFLGLADGARFQKRIYRAESSVGTHAQY